MFENFSSGKNHPILNLESFANVDRSQKLKALYSEHKLLQTGLYFCNHVESPAKLGES